jgi:hypothetical protein
MFLLVIQYMGSSPRLVSRAPTATDGYGDDRHMVDDIVRWVAFAAA